MFGRKGRRFRIVFGMARRALSAARNESCDLILAYGEECWLAFRLLSSRRSRPRLVHHSNGLRAHCSRWLGGSARRWWEPSTADSLLLADHVVVVGEFERRFALEHYRLAESRVTAIPNPVDTVALHEPPDRRNEVLFVGNWIELKGTREMVAAVPVFLSRNPDWCFRIVGADDPSSVRRLFPAEMGDRIIVEGAVRDRLQVAQRMAGAALILLPSHFESYGLVVAEAVLQGCAPVTTPVGLGAELRDGVTGFVFPPRDAEALGAALDRAASTPADERAAIAARARALIEDHTWERAGATMDELLRRVAVGAG